MGTDGYCNVGCVALLTPIFLSYFEKAQESSRKLYQYIDKVLVSEINIMVNNCRCAKNLASEIKSDDACVKNTIRDMENVHKRYVGSIGKTGVAADA